MCRHAFRQLEADEVDALEEALRRQRWWAAARGETMAGIPHWNELVPTAAAAAPTTWKQRTLFDD